MSKDLLTALLNKEFYEEAKDLIDESYFETEIKDIFVLIKSAYETGADIINIPELRFLYNETHSFDSQAKKNLIYTFLDSLSTAEPMNVNICRLALKHAVINKKANQAATLLLHKNIRETGNVDQVKELLEEIENIDNIDTEKNVVDMNIEYLLSRTMLNSKWKFNLPALKQIVDGIGDGTFTIIAGRVESGKSLATISICFSPDGFCAQGATVLYLCNEEDAAATGLRAVSCYTGLSKDEIMSNPAKAAESFKDIVDRVIFIDDAKMSMGGLAKLCKKYEPDIVVADMLDHVSVRGDYAREDQRLGQIYRQARIIAKEYRCAFIGVSQTSADAHGKMHPSLDALSNSKTEKPAACDVILILGSEEPDNQGNYSPIRAVNVAKNKITGRHGSTNAVIKHELSRLVP